MSYFKDLTQYIYSKGEKSHLPVLNIGWLSNSESFITGETSQEFKDKLYRFCLDEYVVLVMRGFHNCEFCGLSLSEWGKTHPDYGKNAGLMGLGDGEIRVIGLSKVYASPTLIYHYVVEHNYKPPQEFVDAVLTGPQPDSAEHQDLLMKYRTR